MYVRFVTPLVHPASRVEAGFFQASWYIYRNGCPKWIARELEAQFRWFNRHLPVPDRLSRDFKRRASIHGICWFDPAAAESISRARYCAWLIEEGGLPVRALRWAPRKEVIWRDAHQIVVKPTPGLPRAFG